MSLSSRYFSTLSRLIVGLVLMSLWITPVAAEEVAITQAKSSHKQLSLASARAVFSMRLNTWPDGTPIRVFVLPDRHPAHASFARNRLNMFPYQLRREWDRQVYSGVGVAPTEVPTLETMKSLVAQTPGSIGYIDKGEVDDTVQILQIQ